MVVVHMSLLRRTLAVLGFAALAFPVGADAQLRQIVSKTVSASSAAATIELEFADDGALEITFDAGTVYVDGEAVGSYEPGNALDTAWRDMLADAMTLENGALAAMLVEWNAADHADGATDTVVEVDRAIDDALRVAQEQADAGSESAAMSVENRVTLLRALVGSANRLGALEEALEGIDARFEVHTEDVVVEEGSVVEGTVVVIGASLRVEGEIEGDAVVVGGALDIRESGVIGGQARIADTRMLRNDGEIRGGLVDVLEDEREVEATLRDRLREEIRAEIRNDLRTEIRNATRLEHDNGFSIMSPLRPVLRGVGGVLEKLILVFVLGLLGAGFLSFAGENMDAIAETARKAPGRSAMVGFAGSFLLIPVWILGAVALAVSIIGIPVAIAWLPLFPLAAALAALLGYVAVARNAGEWLADSNFPWTGWIRKSNPLVTLFGGLLGLTFAFMAGHVISIAPFLGVFAGLLFAIGAIITFFAMQIGFGAVILTRGGRKREYTGVYDPDAAWEAAMSVDIDDDLGPPPPSSEARDDDHVDRQEGGTDG